MPGRWIILPLVLILTPICSNLLNAQPPAFAVDVQWEGSKSCFDPQSPPFTVNGVPSGTRQLRFTMKDLDAPNFVHGGGVAAYNGERQIRRGAFSYRGPCPPSGQHRYRWTVDAEDAAGHPLAIATITKNFPPD